MEQIEFNPEVGSEVRGLDLVHGQVSFLCVWFSLLSGMCINFESDQR